jgi:hypothetical protein
MPNFFYALLITCFFGSAAGAAAQTVKEFQAADGLVRVSAAPAFTGQSGDSAGTDSAQAHPVDFTVDSLTDLTSLPDVDEWTDPLLEMYYMEYATGTELRFPAKLSQLREFLLDHAAEYTGGTPETRSVALVRDLSRESSVHMRTPGPAGSK